MTDTTDEALLRKNNVTRLNVVKKSPEDEARFFAAQKLTMECRHGPFEVDDKLDEVICGTCKARLNPMHVLRRLANEETQWHFSRRRYVDEMRRLAARSRTKCQHCGQITRISAA
jgi:hypothetical protein